jgi:hypothetical protein
MNAVDRVRLHLEAADGVAATLAEAWDVFDFIRVVSRQHEQGKDFAAYAMAAASAVRGRNLLTSAPSIPGHSSPSSRRQSRAAHVSPAVAQRAGASGFADAAGSLASLASLLASRLIASALAADDAADRQACTGAAAEANSICSLLDGE